MRTLLLLAALSAGAASAWGETVFGGTTASLGYNFTREKITVTVTEVGEDPELGLSVFSADGSQVLADAQSLDGAGEYVFYTEKGALTPGALYGYKVAAGESVIAGSFVFAENADWFSARAADDSSVGGAWVEKPAIVDGHYELARGTSAYQATEARSGIVSTVSTVTFRGGFTEEKLGELLSGFAQDCPQSFLALKELEDFSCVWVGLTRVGGELAFVELTGAPVVLGQPVRCWQRIDLTGPAPRVVYGVGDAALTDANGAVVLDGARSEIAAVTGTRYVGLGELDELAAIRDGNATPGEDVPGVTFGDVVASNGFDFTNKIVTVVIDDVSNRYDGETVCLRLQVKDSEGTVVATIDRSLTGPGEYAFDTAAVATLVPGAAYSYEVMVVDAELQKEPDENAATGSFPAGNSVAWFSTVGATGESVGGAWAKEPDVDEDGNFLIRDGMSFAATDAKGGVLSVTTRMTVPGGYSDVKLAALLAKFASDLPQSFLTVRKTESGDLVWVGLVRENGVLTFKDLLGVTPVEDGSFACTQEIDVSGATPRVGYVVDSVRLTDANGDDWFAGPRGTSADVIGTRYTGAGRIASVVAQFTDRALAEAQGNRYESFTDALKAAGDGGEVSLLSNFTWSPDCAGRWTISSGDFRFILQPSASYKATLADGVLTSWQKPGFMLLLR